VRCAASWNAANPSTSGLEGAHSGLDGSALELIGRNPLRNGRLRSSTSPGSGLQAIPRTWLEAAALDGAGPLARFTNVIWPALKPTTAFVATTGLIMSFQAFDVVRVMTQGGPARSTTLFVYAIDEDMFINLRVGRASAWVLGLVLDS